MHYKWLYPSSWDKAFKKKWKRILNKVGSLIEEFSLIKEGDRILVAVSGGKDSLSLLYILWTLQKKAPISYSIFAYTLDQNQPGFSLEPLVEFYESLGVEYHITGQDTYSIVKEKIPEGKTYCSLCSRLRRGILYRDAPFLGANKIALGHHLDDAIETLFLNLFYTGRLASLPPILYAEDRRNIVIRPLLKVEEKELEEVASYLSFPTLPCNLCGSQPFLMRKEIKKWIKELEKRNPILKSSLRSALSKVEPRFLMDKRLYFMEAGGVEPPSW